MAERCIALKIAMIGHKLVPSRSGGIEVAVEALSTRMAALGHDVTLYNRGKIPRSLINVIKASTSEVCLW